ncbi:hypothetical protein [Microbispora bryophytorum]|uniref:hypothetical protein n=1 Tax=Microbispora bryophytorum TaxID=1460882 RepID=UPI0033EFD846
MPTPALRAISCPVTSTPISATADLRTGEGRVPDFARGLRLHGLLDAIRRSAETGTRQTFTPA